MPLQFFIDLLECLVGAADKIGDEDAAHTTDQVQTTQNFLPSCHRENRGGGTILRDVHRAVAGEHGSQI